MHGDNGKPQAAVKVNRVGKHEALPHCAVNDPYHTATAKKLRVFFREADYGAAGAIALSPMSTATVVRWPRPADGSPSRWGARSRASTRRNGPVRTEKNPVDVHVEDGVVIR